MPLASIFSITSSIFAIIALGFVCFRYNFFPKSALDVLSRFVIYLALPALIFQALTSQVLSDIVNIGYLGGYLIGSLAMLIVGYAAGTLFSTKPLARTFDAAGMACANSGFVGYPILLLATPNVASNALAMNMIIENMIIIPLVVVLAELAAGRRDSSMVFSLILRRVITNPIVLACSPLSLYSWWRYNRQC